MADIKFTTAELETEEWRDVVGYEGVYSVSNLGRVRRNVPGTSAQAGHIHRQHRTFKGYIKISLYKSGKQTYHLTHNLVAEAFLGAKPNGKQVNHKNGVKHDNRPANLEYVTSSENMQHSLIVLKNRGKLTEQLVQNIRADYDKGVTLAHLARKHPQINRTTMWYVVHRKTWKHVTESSVP